MLSLHPVPAFQDNYLWVARGAGPAGPTLAAIAVDPGDAAPVAAHLAATGARLVAILVTHHHSDHIGGVAALGGGRVPVYGPRQEAQQLVTHPVAAGDRVEVPELGLGFEVLEVPGHTLGHLAFVERTAGAETLFCGDTLFSAGCGRLFEGSPEQMAGSLARLAALPDSTRVCCAHEYTQSNLRFAATVEPGNPAIAAYAARVAVLRAEGRPSLPSTLGLERTVNPFLRLGVPEVVESAARWSGEPLAGRVAVFAALRRWKDGFR
jgi:hydroxyacylglutathione hydrolase